MRKFSKSKREYSEDIVEITDIKIKYKTNGEKNGEMYMTFTADCDSKRFTIFNNIKGFRILYNNFQRGKTALSDVTMKWCTLGDNVRYNRCCLLKF